MKIVNMFIGYIVFVLSSYIVMEGEGDDAGDNGKGTGKGDDAGKKGGESDAELEAKITKLLEKEGAKNLVARLMEENEKVKTQKEAAAKAEAERLAKLSESEKVLESLRKSVEDTQKENLEIRKENLIVKSGLPERFHGFVQGNSLEEIKASISGLSEKFKDVIENDKKAGQKPVWKFDTQKGGLKSLKDLLQK